MVALGCLKKWIGLAIAVEMLRQHRAQSVVRAARSRSSLERRDRWAMCTICRQDSSTLAFWGLCDLGRHPSAHR